MLLNILNEHQLTESKSSGISKAPVPQNAIQNLKSKIESLTSTLELLAKKKARLDFEIRKQAKALYGKRQELKKLTKSSTVKASLVVENQEVLSSNEQKPDDERRTQNLLQESDRVLKDLGF